MLEFVPKRLQELREMQGISEDEMSIKLKKSKQQIGIWESGVNAPSIENLLLICNTFGVDVSFFFSSSN